MTETEAGLVRFESIFPHNQHSGLILTKEVFGGVGRI
jgi:hypothetical protein